MFLNTYNHKITRVLSLLLALTMGVAMVSCEDDEDIIDDEEAVLSIYEEIAESPSFTILKAAIDKANLTDRLTADGDLTLFAPSDNAFISAGITDLDDYTADELAAILQYHVIEDGLLIDELADSEEQQTLNGMLYVTANEDFIYLNGNTSFVPYNVNVEATNGIIHAIDRVLQVPQSPVTEIISADDDLAILQEAVAQAGIGDVLGQEGPYTIFAPTDGAFERLFDTLGVSSLSEISQDQLAGILQYHVVQDRTFGPEIEVGSQSTLLGEPFTITFDNNDILLVDESDATENATVIAGNRLGTNGIVHIVDEVLLPAEE